MRASSMVSTPGWMVTPGYFTLSVLNQHIPKLNKTLVFWDVDCTMSTSCRQTSDDFEITILSFKYMKQVSKLNPLSRMSYKLWKVSGALMRPNGMRQYLYVPAWHVKVISSQFSPEIGTWRYFELASSVETHVGSSKKSTQSSIFEIGYVSRIVISLIWR